ncbi:NADH-quinone oxidoreductase subunit A [bacterium]|nr:NADH-quinone oxidoreductase subunit A [bacterium]
MAEYLGVVIFLALVGIVAGGGLLVSNLFGPRNPTPEKLIPYECGVDPVGSAKERHPVKFYLVAILFLLFDIEFLFLVILAIMFASPQLPLTRGLLFFELLAFLSILGAGFFYIWRKGALEWD